MPKIEYDPEVKILKIRIRGGKSVDSEIKDNIVLDYNKDGELVKLEIMEVNLDELAKGSKVSAKIAA